MLLIIVVSSVVQRRVGPRLSCLINYFAQKNNCLSKTITLDSGQIYEKGKLTCNCSLQFLNLTSGLAHHDTCLAMDRHPSPNTAFYRHTKLSRSESISNLTSDNSHLVASK